MSELPRWRCNLLIRELALRHRMRAGMELAKIGLHPGQETVLIVLDRFGAMNQRDLGAHLNIEPPTLSSIAKKLEAAGLITRTPCPRDARATMVAPTDHGRELLPEIYRIGRELAETTLAGMDDATVATFMAAMSQAIASLEAGCRPRREPKR